MRLKRMRSYNHKRRRKQIHNTTRTNRVLERDHDQ